MATAATASYSETSAWTSSASDDEKIAFANTAIAQLEDDSMVAQFQENVKQVGTWANRIDDSFDRITRKFADMVAKYGADFPGFAAYNTEWIGYHKRWVANLALSRDVASEHVAILRRFDQIFLDMIESIETDEDRLDVIEELKVFTEEDHNRSIEMRNNFLNLNRDIVDFVGRFNQYIIDRGVELKAAATSLINDIIGIEAEIAVLDKKIKGSQIALAAMGVCLNIIGLIVVGSALAAYQSERSGKETELNHKKAALADINRKQKALASLKTDFDGVKPDTNLTCKKLVLFSEIWPAVRSQATQFREQLEGGMDVVTNIRFRKEVRLARKLCAPLQAGLEKYAVELENRK